MKKLIFLCLLVLLFVDQEVFAQGCAQCKVIAEQAASEVDESSFGSNINYGILPNAQPREYTEDTIDIVYFFELQ